MEHDGLNRKDAEWREAKETRGRSQTAERAGDMWITESRVCLWLWLPLHPGSELMSFLSLWINVKRLLTFSQARSTEVRGHTQHRSSI